ncbi:PREDICTED: lipoyltransferase 1, mitochondrial isoform X1 [Polistes canadensis]|uniref:lipoyltransferase 1, mitochondrial isoform X1 n=1 Tax=Polistes canadensis TaxID=91411 RepID=UPI000718F86C|nr:PREDICTED: lipoyltransferase 1, mitochondrial isoform X1 [Polistes canadensis]
MSLINKCGRIIVGRGVLCSRWNTFERTKLQVKWVSSSFNVKQGQNGSNNDSIRKSVFISQSTDVFTNLALEDWLYRNFDLTNHHILLLWRNDPCVVIGRHQNPWLECDTRTTEKHNIALVRRNSGGGTVYHDNGNLNLSFFTPKQRYNRRYNLDIITRALYREWGLKAVVNEREDIVVEGRYKVSFDVSGTAAKIGRPNAYHHCTLLVAANKTLLSMSLQKKETGIKTNATPSTRSSIKNLTEVNSEVQIDKLINAVGWEYLRTKPLVLEDGGYDHIQEQKGFQMINPSEDWFPGIDKLREQFCSWEWTYGRTPDFSVTKTFDVPAPNGNIYRLDLTLEIQKGIVEEIRMSLPANLASSDFNQNTNVLTNLRGMKYDSDVMDNIIALISCKNFAESMSQNTKKTNMVATQ